MFYNYYRGPRTFYWRIIISNYTHVDLEIIINTFNNICDSYVINEEIKNDLQNLNCKIKLKNKNYITYIQNIVKTCNLSNDHFLIENGHGIHYMVKYYKKNNVIAEKNMEYNKIVSKDKKHSKINILIKQFNELKQMISEIKIDCKCNCKILQNDNYIIEAKNKLKDDLANDIINKEMYDIKLQYILSSQDY